MSSEERRARDPNAISIEFPEGRRLRSNRSRGGGGAFAFSAAGILLGAVALGAGYWLGGRGAAPTPPGTTSTATVNMTGIKYVPDSITVDVGTKVTWVNKDPVYHTVTSDEADGPLQSPNIEAGQSFSFTFTEEGTYSYHCIPHSSVQSGKYVGMIGTVIVRAGGGNGQHGTPIDLPYAWRDPVTTAPPPGWHEWNITLRAEEVWLEVAEGKAYAAWTFNGVLPGPAFRGRP